MSHRYGSVRRQNSGLLGSASSQYSSNTYKGPISLFGGGTRCLTIDLCPDLLIAAAAAAGAAAFFALYQAISAAGRRRKRRRAGDENALQLQGDSYSNTNFLWDILFSGN